MYCFDITLKGLLAKSNFEDVRVGVCAIIIILMQEGKSLHRKQLLRCSLPLSAFPRPTSTPRPLLVLLPYLYYRAIIGKCKV